MDGVILMHLFQGGWLLRYVLAEPNVLYSSPRPSKNEMLKL